MAASMESLNDDIPVPTTPLRRKLMMSAWRYEKDLMVRSYLASTAVPADVSRESSRG